MKKIHLATLFVLLMALGLLIYACGSSSSGGGFANTTVQFTVNGDKITHNANESRAFTIPGVGTDFLELTWFCGNYKNQTNKTVKLTFKKVNNTWELDKEEFSGGSCA
ncbi:MAG: hypothetical protein HY892_14680 [Deltaproteobacteria bacterium]|nr:hypothetical protein [Deltaproteobacteria bacterium]